MKKTTHWLWIKLKEHSYWIKVHVKKKQGQFVWNDHVIGYRANAKKTTFFWQYKPEQTIASFSAGQAVLRNPNGLSRVTTWGAPKKAVCVCIVTMFCFFALWPGGQNAIESAQAQMSLSVESTVKEAAPEQLIETVYLDEDTETLSVDEVLLDDVPKNLSETNIDGRIFEVVESEEPSQKNEASKEIGIKKTTETFHKKERKSQMRSSISHAEFQQAKKYFLHGQPGKAKKVLGTNAQAMNTEQRKLLSEIYFFECRQWVQKSEYTKALVDCQKATRTQKHEKADRFLAAMQEQAQTYYLEAYSLESVAPEKSIQKYQEAMLLGGAKSPWAKKSSVRLKQLRKN